MKDNQYGLTPQQLIFANEYMIDFNGKRAAIKAKYSENTAEQQASRLLSNVKVKKYIDAKTKKAIEKCIITKEQVLQELANIALANGTDFAEVEELEYEVKDSDGNGTGKYKTYKTVSIKNTGEVSQNKRSAIAGIEQTQTGIRVKQHDKVKALELLGKHLELFTEKQKIDITNTIRVELVEE